jgi:hypothetical protein
MVRTRWNTRRPEVEDLLSVVTIRPKRYPETPELEETFAWRLTHIATGRNALVVKRGLPTRRYKLFNITGYVEPYVTLRAAVEAFIATVETKEGNKASKSPSSC